MPNSHDHRRRLAATLPKVRQMVLQMLERPTTLTQEVGHWCVKNARLQEQTLARVRVDAGGAAAWCAGWDTGPLACTDDRSGALP